ncbi:right-handed parallel beta-helix repeat-containing protein [Mycolicibacterium grossiae]|nr:right-handed parallel beta-helix repeat-containing protein [Mycolicibacterium grossiae]QEM43837.1 right-handed parallel beta-helix repeat-containing protein [Mycolicibacterium grossiae]
MPFSLTSRSRTRRRAVAMALAAVIALGGVLVVVGMTRSPEPAAPGFAAPAPRPPALPVGRRAFFVSPRGDDAGPGTLTRPWRSIDRAMKQRYVAGDQLLFQRGGEYFGTIDTTPVPNGARRLYIGAYGEGPRPVLTNAYVLRNPSAWRQTSRGVWRLDLSDPASHGGWTSRTANIGFLRTGDAIHGAKKASPRDLRSPWDFFDDGRALFVRSNGNPSVLAPDLRAAPNAVLISAHSNTEIGGLELTDCGGHAIRGAGPPVRNVHVVDNEIHRIGGSFLIGYANDRVRYGNAVECFDSSANWLVWGNEVHDVYDTAFTCQGSGTWSDIRVTENHFWQNSHTIEFWSEAPGNGFRRVLIDHNRFDDGGGGWGATVRPDRANLSQFTSYGWDLPADILLTDNRITRAHGAYAYFAPEIGDPEGWVFADNDIRLDAGTLMQFGQPQTIAQAAAWAARHGTERGSRFTVLTRP